MGNPLKNRCFNGKNTEKNIQKPFEALQDKLQKLKTGVIRGLEMEISWIKFGTWGIWAGKARSEPLIIKHIGIWIFLGRSAPATLGKIFLGILSFLTKPYHQFAHFQDLTRSHFWLLETICSKTWGFGDYLSLAVLSLCEIQPSPKERWCLQLDNPCLDWDTDLDPCFCSW